MSDDVLERLAAANPVTAPENSADAPASRAALERIISTKPHDGSLSHTRQRHCSGRWIARLFAPAIALAAAIVAFLALAGAGSRGSSIVAEAYAATNSDGVILHYVVNQTVTSSNTAPDSVSRATLRTEVWQSGARWHMLQTATRRQRYGHISSTRSESAETQSATETTIEQYLPGTAGGPNPAGHVFRMESPISRRTNCNILLSLFSPVSAPSAAGCSPIAALRSLYRSGGLRAAGQAEQDGRTVDVLKRGDLHGFLPQWQITVLLDPTTFAPLEIRVSSSPGHLEVARFSDYQRIPLTPSTAKLLALKSHPGATLSVIHTGANGLPIQ